MTDIDGNDVMGAVLQKTIGESAGRGAYIEAAEAADFNSKLAQGRFQLQSSAADIAGGRIVTAFETNLGLEFEFFRRFIDELIIDEDPAGHYQSLCPGTRWGQPAIDEQGVDALARHLATLTQKGHGAQSDRKGRLPKPRLPLRSGSFSFNDARFARQRGEHR